MKERITAMTEYQVTLIDKNNHFRPVSTIVKVEGEFVKQDVINRGIQKICNQRYWTKKELMSYQQVKIRPYDKEKIEAENKARYEAIKEAKYASGEWKRPKSKEVKE